MSLAALNKVFLCLNLLLLAFIGCKKSEQDITLQIWHQMQPEDRAVLTRLMESYDVAHPHIKIQLVYKETEDLRSSFQTAALAGLGPVLVFGPSDQVGPFATMGFIQPLENLFPENRFKNFDPRTITRYKGHVFQIADRIGNHLALVYNRNLLPVPPKNTDELIKMGQDLTVDKNGDGKIDQWGIVWNFTEPFFFIPWFAGFGGWVFDDNGNPALNTPAAVNAFKFVKSLRDEYKIIPPDCDYNTADVLFKEGRAAMLINGPWSWTAYGNAGINYDLARIPQVVSTGDWPAPMVSPLGYSINANTEGKKLEETVKLLDYLLSDSAQSQFMLATGIIPADLTLRQDSAFFSRPRMAGSLSQLETGRAMPIVPELRAIWDAMRPAYQSVLGGSLSPEEAAKKMQQEAEGKIREMNE